MSKKKTTPPKINPWTAIPSVLLAEYRRPGSLKDWSGQRLEAMRRRLREAGLIDDRGLLTRSCNTRGLEAADNAFHRAVVGPPRRSRKIATRRTFLSPEKVCEAAEVDDPIVRAALRDDPSLVPSNAALVKTIEASMDAVEDLASRMAPICRSNMTLRTRLDDVEQTLHGIIDAAEAARLAVKGTLQKTGHPMTGWLLLPPIGARVRVARDYDAKKNRAAFGRDAVGIEGVVGSYELCPRRGVVCRLNDVTPCFTGPGYETTTRLDEIEPADAPAV